MSDNKANESVVPQRKRLNLDVGQFVEHEGVVYRILHHIDFESLLGKNVESGRCKPLRISELSSVTASVVARLDHPVDLDGIEDKDWKVATERYEAIKPLLSLGQSVGRGEVTQRAQELGMSPATLYRWLSRYRAVEALSSLIPMNRGWRVGNSRLAKQQEALIDEVIQSFYLTIQRSRIQKTVIEVFRLCQLRNIPRPGASAIRARVLQVSEREQLRKRGFREKAKNKFTAAPGRFPGADYPLAVIQIDHTPADIILVDDVHRKPIGRPWITLAMDVYSRMITGYYLSFDPPSETSVAMCVAHSILPKEDWMTLHKVEGSWPVWGFPHTIHVDNGADFRSFNFSRSCQMHGIHLSFRPVKQPRYGGHIERIIGTVVKELHDLPGTTFSNIRERKDYDSEKQAVMTKGELEKWIVTFICNIYHKRYHAGIGMSPMTKWEIGINGNHEVDGIGYPPRPEDRMTILLDFLPSFSRTVQISGVAIEGLTYFADTLRYWLNATDAETGQKKQLTFRRDPRDISYVWFFDPELKQYFKVPLADQSLPPMSVWEYQQIRKRLRDDGYSSPTETQILNTITQLRELVEESKVSTKKARRQSQRRREHEKGITPAAPLPATPVSEPAKPDLLAIDFDNIEPFNDEDIS